MKVIAIILFFTLSISQMAIAYPESHLKECILGVKRSPIVLGAPQTEIEDWCDCTLKLILDEGKDDMSSGSYCGHKYFK